MPDKPAQIPRLTDDAAPNRFTLLGQVVVDVVPDVRVHARPILVGFADTMMVLFDGHHMLRSIDPFPELMMTQIPAPTIDKDWRVQIKCPDHYFVDGMQPSAEQRGIY